MSHKDPLTSHQDKRHHDTYSCFGPPRRALGWCRDQGPMQVLSLVSLFTLSKLTATQAEIMCTTGRKDLWSLHSARDTNADFFSSYLIFMLLQNAPGGKAVSTVREVSQFAPRKGFLGVYTSEPFSKSYSTCVMWRRTCLGFRMKCHHGSRGQEESQRRNILHSSQCALYNNPLPMHRTTTTPV